MLRSAVIGLSCVTLFTTSGVAAACNVKQEKVFPGDKEHVRLASGNGGSQAGLFAVFRAPMAVNTDGAPNSYHPYDLLGERKAINRFDNAISIKSTIDAGAVLPLSERMTVFKQWRDNDWLVPNGYRISWKNVIAEDAGKPCVFKSGSSNGYFGSLTALKNNLHGAPAGECDYKNQLDQRFIPAIVIRGAGNPLRAYGAKTGDLVVAINPKTKGAVAAIVGDTGDGNRIGEGSVALNMALLGRGTQPMTYADAKSLDTGSNAMVVAVVPGSKAFKLERPYTKENIDKRMEAWSSANGYQNTKTLVAAVLACAEGL